MDFYNGRAIDPSGGMYHYYLDDGTVFDKRTRHLVNATRFVITHAMLFQLTGEARYQVACARRNGLPAQRLPRPGHWRLRLMLDWDGKDARVR